uniref:hypothetical protein n=1 Tax=Alloprevotella sp. TaxID=1872471 RepID=UPI003FEDFCFF
MRDVEIKITVTGDTITLDGNNLQMLTEDDIKVLVSLAKIMYGWEEGAKEDGNA